MLGLALAGCSTIDSLTEAVMPASVPLGSPGAISGFLGGVVADEPLAALVARNILSAGGNAADAMTAGAFALTVSLPSRASLGGGGACIAFSPKRAAGIGPEAIMFVSPAGTGAGADRPAAVPMMARGLYLLHVRYGKLPFETVVSPAEQMARGGVTASRAFLRDLDVAAGPLSADPGAAAVFFPGGRKLTEGAVMLQPELAGTLGQMRVSGVGDLYQGALARRLVEGAQAAGGGLALEDLRGSLPQTLATLRLSLRGGDVAHFLPPPADGGLATAVTFRALQAGQAQAAQAAGLGAATQWRRAGGDGAAILAATSQPASGFGALPASTGMATLDREGNAVVCAFTMNNLFGTGRMAEKTGVLLAASPRWMPPALLSAGMVVNPNLKAFRAAASGTGQEAAPLAAAYALAQTLATGTVEATPVPEPGRANLIACSRYLPDTDKSCAWAADPRGNGIGVGSN
jgi:gamma-glutamyltranspeptidase/glutathione hydrolase